MPPPTSQPPRQKYKDIVRTFERYTKTDLSYLLSGGFWLVVAQVGIALIALFLSIAFARFVPKDVYGTYRFLLSVFWTLTAFSFTGLPIAFSRAVARGHSGAWMQAVRLSLRYSWPMALISFGLAGYYAFSENPLLAIGAVIIGLIGPFMQSSYFFGSFLVGQQRFRENAVTGIALNLFPALALLGAMYLGAGPIGYLATYLLANVATAAAISFIVYRRHRPAPATADPEIARYGGHLSVMNILSTIASQVDRLLVYHYLGAVDLAVYSFAIALPDQFKSVFSNIATIALPKFAQRPLADIRETFARRLGGFTGLMVLTALVYIAIAPELFRLLFPAYLDAVFYTQIYAIALIPIGNIFPETVLQAHTASRELYIFNIAGSLFQIGAVFAGVYWYGLLGIIASRIASRLFALLLGLVLMYRAPATA